MKAPLRSAITLALVASLAAPAAAAAWTARLYAGTHTPHANRTWPIRVTAYDGGRKLRGHISYEYLYGGQVVSRNSYYSFNGVFHDTIVWPSRSIGYPLTFRVVVTTSLGTKRLSYAVRVRR